MMNIYLLDDWNRAFEKNPLVEKLKELGNVHIFHESIPKDELAETLKNADIIIPIRERTKFTKQLIDSLPNLKLVAQTGKGVAHIDLQTMNEKKIPISVTPGGSATSVAELTIGLMLACMRQLPYGQKKLIEGEWAQLLGRELSGKTLGIIGLGNIGLKVVPIAKALNMNVFAWGPTLTKERAAVNGVKYLSKEELLKTSDVVSLHVRLVKETTNLLSREHFELMKEDSVLINTSRGKVINEQDLIWALQNNIIWGAGLDVFELEPISLENPLLQINNVVLSPHVGYTTKDTFDRFLSASIENIASFIQGKPINILNQDQSILRL